MPTMEKENTEHKKKEKDKVSNFVLHFGGDFKGDSLEVQNNADPHITLNFNGESRKVSLTDLAILMEIYG